MPVEQALTLLLARAFLRDVTVSSAPAADLVGYVSVSGRFIIIAAGPVVTLVLCSAIESALFVV